MRSRLTSSGTWSPIVAASVPLRGEKTKVKALSKPISSTAATVSRKSSSVSPGKPTIRSVERDFRYGGTHLVDQPEEALAAVRASHRLQDSRGAGLERQVRVLADRSALRHRGDHRRAKVLRVRARESDPLDAFYRVTGAEQLAEVRPDVRQEVSAVRVDVLAEQRDLADAGAGKPSTSAITSPGRRLCSRPRTDGTMQ